MTIQFTKRLTHGTEREELFRDYINSRTGWNCYEDGKGLMTDEERNDLNLQFVPFETQKSNELLSLLPDHFRKPYLEGLTNKGYPGIPAEKRFAADTLCFYNDKCVFQGEIKSDMGGWANITYCLSGFLWSLPTSKQKKLDKIYIWDISDDVSEWRYLFVNQIVEYTLDARSGKGLKGSQTPHGRVPKSRLHASRQYLKDLLSYYETVEF